MGKTLIIKGADFSKVDISIDIPDIEPDIPEIPENPPETVITLTKETIQSGKMLDPDLQVGDSVAYIGNIYTTGYSVWSVPVEYADATYKFVGETNFGKGTNTDYCIFAVVLDNENVVIGVVYANYNDATGLDDKHENDTYEIDMSEYDNPASIQFCNSADVVATALLY